MINIYLFIVFYLFTVTLDLIVKIESICVTVLHVQTPQPVKITLLITPAIAPSAILVKTAENTSTGALLIHARTIQLAGK